MGAAGPRGLELLSPVAQTAWTVLTAWAAKAALTAMTIGAGFANPAQAQTAELQPSDALKCLQHIKGPGQQPVYPELEFNANIGARVQVEMEFARPDRAPEVTILLQQASPPFVDAVHEHVRGLRVPCLAETGGSARIKQDFDFVADRRQVHWSTPEDSDAALRGSLWRCVLHPSGNRGPEYPLWALRQEVQGRVLARARFTDGTSAPTVEVFARPYANGLAETIRDWTKDLRLPCHSGGPLTFTITYQFLMEDSRYGFKELTFREFLANVKGIRQQVLQLDTTTMGCPFDVRLNYRQPLLPNRVGTVGPEHSARRPLLEWLAKSELDVRRSGADSIFAADAKLTVPCMKIDLKPQEKS
jgi:hypothetical protein